MESRKTMATALFVGNIAEHTTEATLADLFNRNGFPVKRILLPKLSGGQRTRGYAFVHLEARGAVARALTAMDRMELDGRLLVLHAVASETTGGAYPSNHRAVGQHQRPQRRSRTNPSSP